MNPARDPDSILAAWLDEGPTDLPDVTRRAIVAALPTTNQRRRPIWAPWRFSPMSAPLRAALAVLIATVVIGGGIYLLGPRGSDPGVDVTPSPSPTAALPTPTSPPPPLPDEGVLEPGRYSYDATKVRVILTIPAGWEGGGRHVSHAPARESPDGANLGFNQPTVVFTDPCDPERSAKPVGLTIADFVNAVAGYPHLTESAQEDVTVSGFSGTHLSFVVDTEGLDCVMGLYRQEDFIRAADNGQRQDLWVLDVDGTRLVIDAATYPETPAGVPAEIQAMVDTLVIESLQ